MSSAQSCRVADIQGKQKVQEEQQEEFSIIWEMLTDWSEAEYTSAETTVREEEGAERRRQMAAPGQRETDQTGASAAYLLTDESCRARIRGRHVSAAGALFFPIAPTQVGKKEGEKGKQREHLLPSAP